MPKLFFKWKEEEKSLEKKTISREAISCPFCGSEDLYTEVIVGKFHYNVVRICCNVCPGLTSSEGRHALIEDLIGKCLNNWNMRAANANAKVDAEPELTLWFGREKGPNNKNISINGCFFPSESLDKQETPDFIKITINKTKFERMCDIAQTVKEKDLYNASLIDGSLFSFEVFYNSTGGNLLLPCGNDLSFKYERTSIHESFIEITLMFDDDIEITIPIGKIKDLKKMFPQE